MNKKLDPVAGPDVSRDRLARADADARAQADACEGASLRYRLHLERGLHRVVGVMRIGTDLRGAMLNSAGLQGAALDGANLRGSQLINANFQGASFRDAIQEYLAALEDRLLGAEVGEREV